MLFLLAALLFSGDTGTPKKLKIAMLDIAAKGDIAKSRADIFGDLLQSEVRSRGHSVIGRSDIEQVLGLERMKDSLGCTTTSCLAEIGGALGVDELLSGSVAKIGTYLMVNLKRIDPKSGHVIRNAERRLKFAQDDALVEVVAALVDELYTNPLAAVVVPPMPTTPTVATLQPPRALDEQRTPPAGLGFFCFNGRSGKDAAKDYCYATKALCEELAANLVKSNSNVWHDVGTCTARAIAICSYAAFDAEFSKFVKPMLQCFATRAQCLDTRAAHLRQPEHLVRLELCVPASSKADAESLFL